MVAAGEGEPRSNPLGGEDFEEDDEVASLAGGEDGMGDLGGNDEPQGYLPEVFTAAARGGRNKALRGSSSAAGRPAPDACPWKHPRSSESVDDAMTACGHAAPLHEAK